MYVANASLAPSTAPALIGRLVKILSFAIGKDRRNEDRSANKAFALTVSDNAMRRTTTISLSQLVSTLIIIGCTNNSNPQINETKNMNWITFDTIYDDLPLYLRHPDIPNIWDYQEEYTELLRISHLLEEVKSNGLPESDYNKTLFEFDEEICDLFQVDRGGFIFLIETYAGERNYWFYLKIDVNYQSSIKVLQQKYSEHKIEFELDSDKNWGFIKKYPYPIYKQEK